MNILKIYNLLDPKGNKLQLRLGLVESGDDFTSPDDTGYRWSFIGSKIPMPVRNGTWFNGFPECIMLEWLKGNGWLPHTCVNCHTCKVEVYDIPSKGNDTTDILVERALKHAIELLIKDGHATRAVLLYHHIYGGSISDATQAVRKIYRQIDSVSNS